MTGLEKILAQIEADSARTCQDIITKAQAECDAIIGEAQSEADKIIAKSKDKAVSSKNDIITRAHSTAELQRRSVLLSAKQQIITDSLEKSRQYILSLPDDKYFDLIYSLIKKYSEDNTGEIFFNSRDLKRIPADFDKQVGSIAKGKLTLSEAPVDIDGGFILTYGGIEVNCVISGIFSAESERFIDEISSLLFA